MRHVHFTEVNLLVHATGREWFDSVQSELFLAFSLCVRPMQIMVNSHHCRVFSFVSTEINISRQAPWFIWFYCEGRPFLQRIALSKPDEIYMQLSVRHAVLSNFFRYMYFTVWGYLNCLVWCCTCTKKHLLSEQVLKPPLGNELSNMGLITMSFRFLWCINEVIGVSLNRPAIIPLM